METDRYARTLLVDASSYRVQVGLMGDRSWEVFYCSDTESLEAIFEGVAHCLKSAVIRLEQLHAFALCSGPGSVLGIRLAAMAVQTWRRIHPDEEAILYDYRSLEAVAAILMHSGAATPFHVLATLSQHMWYCLTVQDIVRTGSIQSLCERDLKALPGKHYHLIQRRNGPAPPVSAEPLAYDLSSLPVVMDANGGIFRTVQTPEFFADGRLLYRKWPGGRHRPIPG